MQKPSIPQEQQVVSPVPALSVQEKQEQQKILNTLDSEAAEDKPQKQEELPQAPQVTEDQKLATRISDKFLIPIELATTIIVLATKNAHEDFPTRNDILAVIAVESGFHPKVSYRGSHGLMQIEMKSHRDKLYGRSIFDPSTNTEIGAFVLNQLYEMLGKNKRGAFLAYNSGIGNYLKGHYREDYYRKVMKQLQFISAP